MGRLHFFLRIETDCDDKRMNNIIDEENADVKTITSLILTYLQDDEKTAWIVAFSILLVVATVGNSLVTWYILGRKKRLEKNLKVTVNFFNWGFYYS